MSKARLLVVQVVICVSALLGGSAAQARQDCWKIPITQMRIESNGWVYLNIGLPMTGWNCGPGHQDSWFAFNSTTATGKAQLSVALAAYLSGRRVIMDGAETCQGTVEVLRRFTFSDTF